jgi:methyltransferase (TIGR00027 family)
MGRATAHARMKVAKFQDPTALTLLPDDARARVERFLAGETNGLRERFGRFALGWQSRVMVARTVAIDEAIREAKAPQVVILGAGLDGRAWRMPELENVVVFEVDHPDTQREKRERAAKLAPQSKDIRFVSVDFERDSLDEALTAAGHDPSRPTTWVWEGVVMYLTLEDIEKTLAIIAKRSAPASRLIVLYITERLLRRIVNVIVSRMGEPFRSVFTVEEMHALLAKYGFGLVRDQAIPEIALELGDEVFRVARRATHLRVVSADRS